MSDDRYLFSVIQWNKPFSNITLATERTMSSAVRVNSSRGLYKYLIREVGKLPADARPHYKHHVRQGFNQHRDETDPERVQQIIQQAVKDAKWLVNKYTKKPS